MTQTPSASPTPLPGLAPRLLSLDVARGITIAFMIMVNNNGGSGSWGFMNHAAWNGLTATDLVFPTFVFVMGVSVVFAIESRLARGATRGQLVRHTVQRAVILCLLGIVVNSFPFFELEHMRFYGVLQRIAVCYLAVSLLYLWKPRAWPMAAALVVALVGYWVLLRWVPVPGAGMPGRDVPFMDVRQNLVSWIDRQLFPYHLYRDVPDHNVRDPEGLLSDLPAIGTALMGMLTGLWLRTRRSIPAKATGLAAAAIGSSGAGLFVGALVSAEQEHVDQLLCPGGGGLLAGAADARVLGGGAERMADGLDLDLAGLRLECDCGLHVQRAAPGRVAQRPLHRGGKRTDVIAFLFDHVFAHIPDRGWAAFAYSVSFTAVCFVPVWLLYRKRIFLKV